MGAKGIKKVNVEKTVRAFADWVSSEDGRRAIEETLKKAKEINRILDEAHRPDPEVLHIRFTI